MSKHLGNVLEPIPLMDEHGADAVRWFMLAGGSPWQARRVGHTTIQEVVRKILLTYWNTVSFQSLYARAGRLDAAGRAAAPGGRAPRARPVGAVRGAPAGPRGRRGPRGVRHPARRAAAGDVRRRPVQLVRPPVPPPVLGTATRPRWRTLHECLRLLTLLMAPFTPFITERVWQDLFARSTPDEPPSRCTWPRGRSRRRTLVDDELAAQMATGAPAGRAGPGRPGRRRGSAPGSRCRRALVAAPGWAVAAGRAARPGRPRSSTSSAVGTLGEQAGELVDVQRQGELPGARQAVRQGHPPVAAAIAAADAVGLAAAAARHRLGHGRCSTASRSPWTARRSWSPRPRGRAGRSPRDARRDASRSTSR